MVRVALPQLATALSSCTSPISGPVLGGVDVVEYFSLADDATAVQGSPDLVTRVGKYDFFFSTQRNKALFEVNPRLVQGGGRALVVLPVYSCTG